MHYGKYVYSKLWGVPTIMPIPNPNQAIGNVYGFSTLDYAKLNALYDCKLHVTLLSEWSGSLMTKNYPSKYKNNLHCFWLIKPRSKQLVLTFKAVDIESSSDCSKDYIKVYDGDTKTSRVLLDKSCGNVTLPLLIASGNLMLIEFVSDSSITAPGFTASYFVVTCGGTFTTKTGEFSSPFYPENYRAHTECSWTIVAPRSHKIILEFKDFDLENSTECAYDYVTIRDGGTKEDLIKGKYCGSQKIHPFSSTGNSMMVSFVTDGKRSKKGFLANYTMFGDEKLEDPSTSKDGPKLNDTSKSSTLHNLMNGYVKPWTFLFCIIMDLTLGYTDNMISVFVGLILWHLNR
ncbi:embryonic protein UVS.2-like [Latimeria chalumnae]|uniref:embryonic protein UVS.2-like n=1 Tax=Latimeria chalumnae TaxID=7897 RepID=UPI00313AB996